MMDVILLAQQERELRLAPFFPQSNIDISLGLFLVCAALTVLLSGLLSVVYVKYGMSLSNRRAFANNFVMLSLTTMLVIALVKSSLALSLGLVGALSIVRFRAAIKEPEELTYLFLCIGIGLGFGAAQIPITLISFVCIVLVLIVKGKRNHRQDSQNMMLTVRSRHPQGKMLELILDVLKRSCARAELRRLDEGGGEFEALFIVDLEGIQSLQKIKEDLLGYDGQAQITFLDSKGGL